MKTLRWFLPRLILSLGMVALLLAGAEWAFTRYVVISDSLAMTRMHLRWVEKYWYPENSLGYRDTEWTNENLSGKTAILVVGDSFPSGHGVNYVADRFPNVLNQELGAGYAVMLAAEPGFDTDKEIIALRNYPHPADALVLSYFINDIVPACKTVAQIDPYVELADIRPSKGLQSWLDRSNLLDYLYWSVYIRHRLANSTQSTMDIMADCYWDYTVWGYHTAQLQTIYNWAYLQNIPLVVVVFPHLADTKLLSHAVAHVSEFFARQNVPVINQSEVWASYPVQERVANHLDWHPSVKIHREVGQLLAQENSLQFPLHTVRPLDWEKLLLPAVYADYQAQAGDPLIGDHPVFIVGSDYGDFFLNVAEAANMGFYLKSEAQAEYYQLIAASQNIVTENQILDTEALDEWRISKAGEDLHALGFQYVLISREWRGWLTPAEFERITFDYELVHEWQFPAYGTDYQLLRAR